MKSAGDIGVIKVRMKPDPVSGPMRTARGLS